MPFINDGYGCIREEANPHTGKATLYWRPLHPTYDNAEATGALAPNWSADDATWNFKPVLEFEAKEWAYDDKPPFSWYVTTRPPTTWLGGYAGSWANVFTTLVVFVAPHVTVRRLPAPFYRLVSSYANPDIRIIRVDSIYEVPLPGSEPNLGHLLGDRPTLEYFNGRLSGGDLLDEVNAGAVYDSNDPLSIPDVRIRREDLSLIVEKPTRFQIKVNLHETHPSFFKIGVFHHTRKLPPDFKLPPGWEDYIPSQHVSKTEAHQTLFKIIYGGAATVEFKADGFAKAGMQYIRAKLEVKRVGYSRRKKEERPVHAGWLSDDVETQTVIVQDRFAEPEHYNFKSGHWSEVEADPDWHGLDTIFQLGIGFIPVVGQLYDVADIVSVALTGEDLWGVKKSETDIILMGGFAMLGVLGDLAKYIDLGQMTRIGGYLFPGSKVVSLNPNFPRFLVRAAFSGTPAFTHAGEVLAKKHGDELMREMDALIKAGDEAGLTRLAKRFETEFEQIMRANAKTIPFSSQPATIAMLRNGKGELGTMLRNIDGLPPSVRDQVANIWDEAHKTEDLTELLDDIKRVSSTAYSKLLDALKQKMIDDVNNDPAIIRRAAAYFARYGKPYTPYGYLTKVAGKGTEAIEAFELKFGEKALDILKDRRSPPDAETIIARYGDQIDELINDIDTYDNHRKMITSKFSGLGIALNSDHILESRFRKSEYFEGSVDSSLFRAILVPANLDVAKKMRASGHDIGWYIHTQKTARMNELLPQKNDFYSAEEIADAYQLFWIHEMGMDPKFFQNLFEEELQYLYMAQKGAHVIEGIDNPNAGKIVFTAIKDKDELIKTVYGRIGKMKLQWFADTKVGQRVSDAPGLD